MQVERWISDQLCPGIKLVGFRAAVLPKKLAFVGRHHAACEMCQRIDLFDRKDVSKHVVPAAMVVPPGAVAKQLINHTHVPMLPPQCPVRQGGTYLLLERVARWLPGSGR